MPNKNYLTSNDDSYSSQSIKVSDRSFSFQTLGLTFASSPLAEKQEAEAFILDKLSPQNLRIFQGGKIPSLGSQLELFSTENLRDCKDMAELLSAIAFIYEITPLPNVQNHLNLKSSCNLQQHYSIHICPYCFKRHFYRLPCNSFFCPECKKYSSSKYKRNVKNYLWNANHFYFTFTLPPEIQEKVSEWNDFIIDKGNFIRTIDLVYKSISESLFEYVQDLDKQTIKGKRVWKKKADRKNLKVGFILLPHTYSSLTLDWFFHMNALVCSKAIDKDGNFVDIQFNFNKLREIYKKILNKNFKTFIKDTPQVRAAKKKGSVYISYQNSIYTILDYFKHLPLRMKNIISIKGSSIIYQTAKSRTQGIKIETTLLDFYNKITQHIPPKNFRTARTYGLYSNHDKKHKEYPISPSKPSQKPVCDDCGEELDFLCLIHSGELRIVNPYKLQDLSMFMIKNAGRSILDYVGFELTFLPQITAKGRIIGHVLPPPDLQPLDRLKFPKESIDLFTLEGKRA